MEKVNRKRTKKQPSVDSDMYKEIRRFGVLIEHVDEKVGLVAEQYGGIKRDIGDIKKTLDSHTEMIGELAVDMAIVKQDVGELKKDVGGLKQDVGELKKDVGGLKQDVGELKKDVGGLTVDMAIVKEDAEFIKNSLKKKVDVDEFAALERRVLLLEKRR